MRTALLAILSTIALALMSGCVSGSAAKSAQHTILAAGTHGVETSWTPTEDAISQLEKKLARMFTTPDARISGIVDGIPPYSLSEYNIRYTGTGPVESRYILGEAVHKDLPEAQTLLSADRFEMPKNGGPRYFTVMYKMTDESIKAVRFNAP